MRLAITLAIIFLATGACAESGGATDCGHEHARYEVTNTTPNARVDLGTRMWMLRWGFTTGPYAGVGSSIPAAVYEMIGGPDKHAFVHGPGISSMFVNNRLEDLRAPVDWVGENDGLPSHMRIMENNGVNELLTIEFIRCEKSPYTTNIVQPGETQNPGTNTTATGGPQPAAPMVSNPALQQAILERLRGGMITVPPKVSDYFSDDHEQWMANLNKQAREWESGMFYYPWPEEFPDVKCNRTNLNNILCWGDEFQNWFETKVLPNVQLPENTPNVPSSGTDEPDTVETKSAFSSEPGAPRWNGLLIDALESECGSDAVCTLVRVLKSLGDINTSECKRRGPVEAQWTCSVDLRLAAVAEADGEAAKTEAYNAKVDRMRKLLCTVHGCR